MPALIAGFAAFATWGLIPVYWKLLKTVSAPEILAHRCIWTTIFLIVLLTWQRRWPELRDATRSRRTLLYCLASGLSLSINWLFFIWAVNAGRVVETSLGYFMTPLVNVLFGHRYTDLGPFRAIRWDACRRLRMRDTTFGWTCEMQVKALRKGLKVAEVPVSYRRRVGVSKITGTVSGTLRAGYKILWTIARYGFGSREK